MNAIEPKVREFCARSLDPLVGSGGFDFIDDLGAQMPMRTIGMLLGIPEQDQEALRDRIDEGLRLETGEMPDARARWPRRRRRRACFEDYIDWRAEHPSDDLMTELLQAEFEDTDGERAPAHPGGGARLRQPARRRRQRDHDPADRLDGQGAGRAPRPAPRARRGPQPRAQRHRGAAALRGAVARAGALRDHGRRAPRPDGPRGQHHAAAQRRRATATTATSPTATGSTSTARSTTTCRSATASTSASAPRWPASRAGSPSTRCCSGSPSGRSNWDNAVQARTSTVRGWETLPVLTS